MTDVVTRGPRSPRAWHECSRAQQAALLGGNPDFQAWIGAADKNEAAEIIRTRCDVESRRELDTTTAASEKFDALSRDYFRRLDLQSLEASMLDGPGYEPASEPELPARPALRASRKRILVLTTMNIGYWPWQGTTGLLLPLPTLVKFGRKFKIGDISISDREHGTLMDHDLIMPFRDDDNAFTITETGREWLKQYWMR